MYAKLPEGLPSGGYGWICSRSDVLAPVHHTGAAGGDVHGRLQFTSTNHVPGAKPRAGAPPFLGKNPSANPQPGKLLDCVHESNSGRRWFWVSPRSRVAHLSLHSSCFRKVQSLGDRGQPKGDASTAGRNGTVIIKGNQQRQAGSDS